ncbi:MAG TPA: hypothetical protein VMV43_03670 [Candidatus Nanopelagicaceae bacterium]|nr:hypothetical protein [Candidatus Nanopelagicaceae bacterium]
MSTTEELKSELSKVNEIISERINKANDLKLPGKIRDVAMTFGENQDWGSGRYFYSEKNLSLSFESSYMKVDLGHGTEKVFEANLHENDVGDIHLYIPGDWEKRIEELYSKIPELQQKEKNSRLQNELNELKKKWNIKEPIKCPFWQYCTSYRKFSNVCTEDQSSCMSFKEFKAGERLLEVINLEEKSI